VVVLRTFSKLYGLAGLRIGYGVMEGALAEMLNRIRLPFNVNSLAQKAAAAALSDDEHVAKTLASVREGLEYLYARLSRMGVKYFPTQANFILFDTGRNAMEVFERMLRQGVIVRDMTSYGLPTCIRVSVGSMDENARFARALSKVLS
jgi:histidinol-phosphate aminotransferase